MMDFNVQDENNDGMVDNTDIPMEQAPQMDTNDDGRISQEEYESFVNNSPEGQRYQYAYGKPWQVNETRSDPARRDSLDSWKATVPVEAPTDPTKQYNDALHAMNTSFPELKEDEVDDTLAQRLSYTLRNGMEQSDNANYLREKYGIELPESYWKKAKKKSPTQRDEDYMRNYLKKNVLPSTRDELLENYNNARKEWYDKATDEYNTDKAILDRWNNWKPEDLEKALKEGDEEKAEQIVEEAPEVTEQVVQDTPLNKEAEQILDDTDKRNDEVKDTAVKETVDEVFQDPMKKLVEGIGTGNDNLPAISNGNLPESEQLAEVEEATPEEEEKWNNHFRTGTTELAPINNTPSVNRYTTGYGGYGSTTEYYLDKMKGLPSPKMTQTDTQGVMEKIPTKPKTQLLLGEGERKPETQTESKGQMEKIPPVPPVKTGYKEPIDGNFNIPLRKQLELKLPHLAAKLPTLQIPDAPLKDFGFDYEMTPISWDDTKDKLHSLGGYKGSEVSMPGLSGVGVKDFKQNIEGPSYTKGHEIEPPKAGTPTSSTGPTASMFKDIMNGRGGIGGGMGGFGNASRPMQKGRHNSLKGRGKVGSGSTQMSPMKLPSGGKGSGISSGKNKVIFKKLQEYIRKNFQHWKHNKHGHVWEKGAISIYVNDTGITIKYGSYRRETLDVFARKYPDLLINVAQEMGV